MVLYINLIFFFLVIFLVLFMLFIWITTYTSLNKVLTTDRNFIILIRYIAPTILLRFHTWSWILWSSPFLIFNCNCIDLFYFILFVIINFRIVKSFTVAGSLPSSFSNGFVTFAADSIDNDMILISRVIFTWVLLTNF